MMDREMPRSLGTWFLHSHKIKLPPYGARIVHLPVSHLRKTIENFGEGYMKQFYYSRKRAISEIKRINNGIIKNSNSEVGG
jgi:hypothetical protein